jgi:hypothetical protein
LKPQASQNWPVLAVPHVGQDSPARAAASGGGALTAGDGPDAGLPAMRMPHTSQKSSVAETWPSGHTAIAAYFP